MAWKFGTGKTRPLRQYAFVAGAVVAVVAGIIIPTVLHHRHQIRNELTAASAQTNQQGPLDPLDSTPPSVQQLSSPAPRHRAPEEESDNLPPLPLRTDSSTPDPLRSETLDLQQRLRTFRSQWKDAQSAAREKFFHGAIPASEFESEQRDVDERFAARYAGQFASEALADRAKLLQAVPEIESSQNYGQVRTVQQLMDIERDFTELRIAYLRR